VLQHHPRDDHPCDQQREEDEASTTGGRSPSARRGAVPLLVLAEGENPIATYLSDAPRSVKEFSGLSPPAFRTEVQNYLFESLKG
jgi:hypothetical protein